MRVANKRVMVQSGGFSADSVIAVAMLWEFLGQQLEVCRVNPDIPINLKGYNYVLGKGEDENGKFFDRGYTNSTVVSSHILTNLGKRYDYSKVSTLIDRVEKYTKGCVSSKFLTAIEAFNRVNDVYSTEQDVAFNNAVTYARKRLRVLINEQHSVNKFMRSDWYK